MLIFKKISCKCSLLQWKDTIPCSKSLKPLVEDTYMKASPKKVKRQKLEKKQPICYSQRNRIKDELTINWNLLFKKELDREAFIKRMIKYLHDTKAQQVPEEGLKKITLKNGQCVEYYDFNGVNVYSLKMIERIFMTTPAIIEKELQRYVLLLYRDSQCVNDLLAKNYSAIRYDKDKKHSGRHKTIFIE